MKKILIIINTFIISFFVILFFYIKSDSLNHTYKYIIKPLVLEDQKKRLDLKSKIISNQIVDNILRLEYSNIDTINKIENSFNQTINRSLLIKKLSYYKDINKNIDLIDYNFNKGNFIHTVILSTDLKDEKVVNKNLAEFIDDIDFDFSEYIEELFFNLNFYKDYASKNDVDMIISYATNLKNFLSSYKPEIILVEISPESLSKLKYFISWIILLILNLILVLYFPSKEIKREFERLKKEINK